MGIALVTTVDPDTIRFGIGVLLLAYSLYSLIRPAFKPPKASFPADLGVGVINGLISGLTGLGGVAVTVWCQLRGGKKDELRAVFQPVLFATFVMTTISFAIAGTFTIGNAETLCVRPPGARCRHLVGFRALRKARRCRVP